MDRSYNDLLAAAGRAARMRPTDAVPDLACCPGRNAVLGVQDGVVADERTQPFSKRAHAGEDALFQGWQLRRGRDDGEGSPDRTEEADPGIAERDHAHRVSGLVQSFGKGQGVNHPTARLDRVGDQADGHRRLGHAGGRRAHGRIVAAREGWRTAMAAATRAACAALAVTIAPASCSACRCLSSPCWSARAPST